MTAQVGFHHVCLGTDNSTVFGGQRDSWAGHPDGIEECVSVEILDQSGLGMIRPLLIVSNARVKYYMRRREATRCVVVSVLGRRASASERGGTRGGYHRVVRRGRYMFGM